MCGPDGARPLGGAGRRRCRCSPARCCRWASGSPSRCPPGVHDVGVEVWSQPDAFARVGPAGAPTTRRRPGACTQGELWRAAAAGSLLTDGGRLLSEANPASPPGIATFTEPLARGGSLVLVAHAEPGRLEATYAAERATARFP